MVTFTLLATRLWAQDSEELHKVRFLTQPSRAEVYLDVSGRRRYEKFLGLSDKEVLLDLREFKGASGFTVILRKDHYFDKRERIPAGYFGTRDTYPEAGRIVLEPENWTVPIVSALLQYRYPLAFVFALFGLTLGKFWQRQARVSRRLRTLENLKPGEETDSRVGSVLGDWRLVGRLGQGANATVYRALPNQTLDSNQAVAVKVFSSEATSRPDFQERFQREARIYGNLHHPGIVELRDWGSDDGLFYLVMELVEGEPLCPSRIVGEEKVLALLQELAEALRYAHSKGVIHRDVKPANVVLDSSGRAKLLDFGLARELLSTFTQTGQAMGTPVYMAPEQIEGKLVDHRSDQYAFGALAFELFTGRKTFLPDSDEAASVLFRQINEDPPLLRQIEPGLSEKSEFLVSKLLRRDPSERYPNMEEVLAALRECSRGVGAE